MMDEHISPGRRNSFSPEHPYLAPSADGGTVKYDGKVSGNCFSNSANESPVFPIMGLGVVVILYRKKKN
jgi:hypothetical protein